MYLLNSVDNMARRTYYGVSWVPWPIINSVYFDYQTQGQTQFINAVNVGNSEYAPFKIVITEGALGSSLIEVGVKIIRDPNDNTTFGNVKLRVALTEKTVAFATPPGSNGEREFFSVCRKMLPDANGSTFTIPAPGDTVELSLQYVPTPGFIQAVNFDSLRVVAFVQDDVGKEMYQSDMLYLVGNYVAQIHQMSPDVIAGNTTSATFDAVIRNIGLENDKYDVSLTFDGPSGWAQEFTTVNGTFPIGEIDSVEVASGDSTIIMVNVNPNGITGFGKTTVHFASKNVPTMSGSTTLRFATHGLEVLLVDDQSKDAYEDYMIFELDKTSYGYGVVSSNAVPAAAAGLNTFGAIIWMCANATPTLNPDEITALGTYLDGSGRLYLSGTDIAYELADPTSPYYTTNSLEFVTDYLHSDYVKRSPPQLAAIGIDGDPISDGLGVIGLIGGTGAGTITIDRKPNEIAPAANDPNAAACIALINAPNNYCGVRTFHPGTAGLGRVVFTTFGFETVSDSTKRDILAGRILTWLMDPTAIGDQEPLTIANRFELKANYPNPFNPSTTISYVLPNSEGNHHTSLVIYNQLGQKVRNLVNETQGIGEHKVIWDGRDDAGNSVASGVYFYQLRYGNHQATQKMLLVR
jgi:hypothetical protein